MYNNVLPFIRNKNYLYQYLNLNKYSKTLYLDKKIPAFCGIFFRSDDQYELHHATQLRSRLSSNANYMACNPDDTLEGKESLTNLDHAELFFALLQYLWFLNKFLHQGADIFPFQQKLNNLPLAGNHFRRFLAHFVMNNNDLMNLL